MKHLILVLILSSCAHVYGQQKESITTMDFVQILNDNEPEAVYYFQNNWKVLRESAIKKGHIESFQVMETPFTEDAPFDLILITTYENKAQYDLREAHFRELIKEMGELKLMNERKPNEFRKTIFSKEMVRHWK
ncbi:MAG: hypothetical protein RIA69_20290 [Cyclobacteriaceae bacterium]